MFVTIRLKRLLAVLLICCLAAGLFTVLRTKTVSTFTEDGVEVPILMYHHILKDSKRWNKYIIGPGLFEEDLRYLSENGYTTITVQDLIDYVYSDKPLPEKPVMLTFDDGYYNNYLYAYPLLKQYNMKAVISIIGSQTDLYSESGERNGNYTHVTWDDVNEMLASGLVEIQNHTYDMHTNKNGRDGTKRRKGESEEAYKDALWNDLERLQQGMKEHTGYVPRAFTYPFGSVSKESYSVIRDLGFLATLSCSTGTNRITSDPDCLYLLRRYLRPSGKSSEQFFSEIFAK